jgi:hypothetical protein
VLIAAALGACSTGSAPAKAAPAATRPAPAATGPSTTAATVAPRAARQPETVAAVAGYRDTTPPPVIHATGTNYVAMVNSLERYRSWLLGHHPDSALVHEFEQRGTVAYENDVRHLDALRRQHRTEISVDQHVTFTVASVHGSLMTFRAHEVVSEDRDLDGDGNIVATFPYDHPNDFVIVMVRGAGNRWRLADVTQVSLDPVILL